MADTLLDHGVNSKANCRIKVYPDGTIGDIMVCSLPCFTRPDWERVDKVSRQYAGRTDVSDDHARKRAKRHVQDYILCNKNLDVFVTLTLAPKWLYAGKIQSRTDYTAVNRKVQQWLADRVRRHGLRYVGVYEYHARAEADGKQAIHVHCVCNHDALKMVDSGHKYADKLGHWHKIYNVPDWNLGITTAMYLYGDRGAATSYICKYIYKSEKPVGGRWYMHSHNLREPAYEYMDVDYMTAPGRSIYVPQAHASFKFVQAADIDMLTKR